MSAMSRGLWAVAALGVASLGWMTPSPAQAQWGGRDPQAVYCAGDDGRPARCAVPWRGPSDMVQQLSKADCVRGRSWGTDDGSVWVTGGCRANFLPARGGWGGGGRPGWGNGRPDRDDDDRPDGGGWRPGPDWNREIQLRCDSNGSRYQLCQVDVGRNGRVRLVRQISDTRCREGDSWGWNRAGVWVDNGCRNIFSVDRRW